MVTDYPHIDYINGQEVLLFSFKMDDAVGCPGSIYLIDNATDPFNQLPNSQFNNPGNEFTVFDPVGGSTFEYHSNYAPAAWDCHDNDGDGILNAHEDTNGNGEFDPGVDASNLDFYNLSDDLGIRFKLQLMPDGNTWGVYARPDDGLPSLVGSNWGSAQVTVVMPKEYTWSNLTSETGTWLANATVHGPSENPSKTYTSFGMMIPPPASSLSVGVETLLFTFKKTSECPDDLHLIDNGSDPFLPPNSYGTNPGNDISVWIPSIFNLANYEGNYAPAAWDCHDNDGDGVLNAHEDTNGNGVFDPNSDVSDLNTAEIVAQNGQINFKLQLQPDGETWTVYAKPENGIDPSVNTITGAAQVTIVMPKGYEWNSLQSIHGTWQANVSENGPIENPNKKYVSFGFVTDFPHIEYKAGVETALFSFKKTGDCPDDLHLFNNLTDPFKVPNSLNTNPGNDIAVIDIGAPNFPFYTYGGNYALAAWDCHDNDNDGVVNALEDSNGNGVYDIGVDASNLNTPPPPPGISFKLQLLEPNKWGVFAKPHGINPSLMTITGTAQVTIVMPKDYALTGLSSVHGSWVADSNVSGPIENPTKKYIQIGFNTDYPHIDYVAGQETLLFTFNGNGTCPDSIYLIDNATDLFNVLPNSMYSNPGNELTVFDPVGGANYSYSHNYAPSAWSCHDNDDDGILNAIEDTNGNGQYDAGVDASDLNGGCPLHFIEHPESVHQCSEEAVLFGAVASNGSLGTDTTTQIHYMWQRNSTGDTTSGWVNISAFTYADTLFVGYETDTLGIFSTAGMNGNYYRLAIWTDQCPVQYSYAAMLQLEGPITVTQEPSNTTACAGSSAIFQSTVSILYGDINTVTYQWEFSTDNGQTWNEVSDNGIFSGTKTSTLSISNVSGMYGWRFRMRFSTPLCNANWTNYAKLVVEGPLTITENPSDFTNCADKEAIFVAKVSNPGIGGVDAVSKQWQYSSDGGTTWTDITQVTQVISGNVINFSGAETDTLLASPITGLNGYLFRSNYWTATCNLQTTTAALLSVEGPITFTDQPDDVTHCAGSSTCFTVAINNASMVGILQYQWQRFVAGSWVNLSNSSPYSGTFTNQLCISDVTGLYNSKFRCRVKTPNCEWVASDLANLYVEGPIMVNLQPEDATVCANKPHLFNTTIANPGFGQMTYRWQYKKPGDDWKNFPSNIGHLSLLGAVNPTDPDPLWQSSYNQDMNLTNVDGLDGWMFRLFITTPHCTQYTNEVTLHVLDKCGGACDLDNDGLTNDIDEDDDNDGLSDFIENWMTETNVQGGWNYLDSNGDPIHFDPCSVDSDGDGIYDYDEDTDGDLISNGEETNGDGVSDGNPLDPSNPSGVLIIINAQPAADVNSCSNAPFTFATTVTSFVPNETTYRWQYSVDGGTSWEQFATDAGDLAPFNNGQFQGAFTDDLTISKTDGLDGALFQLIVSSPQYTVTTAASALHVLNACTEGACDIDEDGITNSLDDDFQNCGDACMKLKLQFLPDHSGWAVMAKPFGGYVPTPSTLTTAGRVTLVAPANFVLDGFASPGGEWTPVDVHTNVPGHPGRKYITFELNPGAQGTHIAYGAADAVPLFQFAKTGNCPDSLYLLEGSVPSVLPNLLTGQDEFFSQAIGFDYCGVFARKAWLCNPPTNGPGGPGNPVVVVTDMDFNGHQPSVDKLLPQLPGTKHSFEAYPNPAADLVSVAISDELVEGRPTIALWDLQGRKRLEVVVEAAITQLDLQGLPAGAYFVSLAQNGKVVERKQLIIN